MNTINPASAAGSGADTVHGDDGDDQIHGPHGNDVLIGAVTSGATARSGSLRTK